MKIDKHIPMPAPLERSAYPFSQMEVGDSFFTEGGSRATRNKVKTASRYYTDARGWRFSIRREGDGYRCWRTA